MPSMADVLGISWTPLTVMPTQPGYRLGLHAERQVREKGFDRATVLAAADSPAHTYENGRYAGQMRHIRGNICAVVDPVKREVVTVYLNVETTGLRADQRRDRDQEQRGAALKFEARRKAGAYDQKR